MKIKYTGPLSELTVRHKVFEQGRAVELDPKDDRDASLARKVLARPDFKEVKAGRPRKVSDGDEG